MNERLVNIIVNGDIPKRKSMTTQSFLTSICVSIFLFLVCATVFSLLRKRLRSVYEPRTFVITKHLRTPASSDGFFSWILEVFKATDKSLLESSGLDAYFFLRYILFVMVLCGAMGIPLLAVLLPIHLTGNRKDIRGMDRLSMVNISDSQSIRHAAHLTLCITFTLVSLLVFKKELYRYFRMRAEYIVRQEEYVPGPSSTILIKGLCSSYQTEEAIRGFFTSSSVSPVKRIWLNRDYSELEKLVQKRNKILHNLETLEIWLIERSIGVGDSEGANRLNGCKDATVPGNLWREYLCPADMALMNGEIGTRLSCLKTKLNKLNCDIENIKQCDNAMPRINSCFVQFDSKLSAFIAARSLSSEQFLGIGEELCDRIHPADIVWSNLGTRSCLSTLSWVGATLLNFLMIFGWAIPITLISMVTQVQTVAENVQSFKWVAHSPKVTLLLSNVMAPLIVSAITSQVPTFFRFLARLKGYPTNMRVEMDVQKYLFLFMFFQLFLIVTLSTGLPGLMVQLLVNTSEGAITIANGFSRASTFFISYIMATSLTTAGNTLLQSQQLLTTAYYTYTEKTPRQKLANKCRYSVLYWGSVFPSVTTVGAIAIAYALISPAIMITAFLGLSALYVAFKYRIMYCYVPQCVSDGDYYPKAIFQLFTGFYCQQVSLLGVFLVSRQMMFALIVAVLIISTMVAQHNLNCLFTDLRTRIPKHHHCDAESQQLARGQLVEGRKGGQYSVSPAKNRNESNKSACSDNPSWYYTPFPINTSPLSDVTLVTSPHTLFLNPKTKATSVRPLKDSSPEPTSPVTDRLENVKLDSNGSNKKPGSTTCSSGSTQSSPGRFSPGGTLQEAWTHIFDAVSRDFSSLTEIQQNDFSEKLFEHPDKRMEPACVWIPRDWKGVAQDQVLVMQTSFTNLRSTCDGATMEPNGEIVIQQLPPDFDPLKAVKI